MLAQPLNQYITDVNVYVTHLQTLLNCRFWFGRPGVRPQILLPGMLLHPSTDHRALNSRALERQGLSYSSSLIHLTYAFSD